MCINSIHPLVYSILLYTIYSEMLNKSPPSVSLTLFSLHFWLPFMYNGQFCLSSSSFHLSSVHFSLLLSVSLCCCLIFLSAQSVCVKTALCHCSSLTAREMSTNNEAQIESQVFHWDRKPTLTFSCLWLINHCLLRQK